MLGSSVFCKHDAEIVNFLTPIRCREYRSFTDIFLVKSQDTRKPRIICRSAFGCQWRSKRVPWVLAKYNNDHKCIPWCYEGFDNVILETVNSALQNLENHKVLFEVPCRSQWRTMSGLGPCRGQLWSEVEKGAEHGSIALRRNWTERIMAEGFRTSLPHLSQYP